MEDRLKLFINVFGPEKAKRNELISDHAVSKLGGKASVFIIAYTTKELIKIINTCIDLGLKFFLFGTGSKIAFSDSGFSGVIIKNRTNSITVIGVKGKVSKYGVGVEEAIVEVDSGTSMGSMIDFLKKQSLDYSMIEDLGGSVGGNLFFSKSMQIRLKSAKVINEIGEIEEVNKDDLNIKKQFLISAKFNFKSNS